MIDNLDDISFEMYLPDTRVTEIIRKSLEGHDYFVYGSRSKWGENLEKIHLQSSDWDVAVEYSKPLLKKLVAEGWRILEDKDYQDCTTVRILEKSFLNTKIQISLREQYLDFKAAWMSIPDWFYAKYINKRSPNVMPKEDISMYLNHLVWLSMGYYSYKKSPWKREVDIAPTF
jgi:predicted nucleotidyltransferase